MHMQTESLPTYLYDLQITSSGKRVPGVVSIQQDTVNGPQEKWNCANYTNLLHKIQASKPMETQGSMHVCKVCSQIYQARHFPL
ncbi:hypothetical protein DPMN_072636 [Dreissena polymorpha]|uniref:Uncharacterized protein n=1 Tax=Dreissena polymorpha TaxID=45954 RepID=A0A9D4BXM9_DREPO|nr:hypothetical protein DPMN_072636 [Dreissena polymorpha]